MQSEVDQRLLPHRQRCSRRADTVSWEPTRHVAACCIKRLCNTVAKHWGNRNGQRLGLYPEFAYGGSVQQSAAISATPKVASDSVLQLLLQASLGCLIFKQLADDLTPVAGLALVGQYLKSVSQALSRLDAALPVRGGASNGDICRAYPGLLVHGKSDFDAIENFRGHAFFRQALGIGLLPSCPTLRQRLGAKALEMFDFAPAMIDTLLESQRPDYGVLPCGWLPLDTDTFAHQGFRGHFSY